MLKIFHLLFACILTGLMVGCSSAPEGGGAMPYEWDGDRLGDRMDQAKLRNSWTRIDSDRPGVERFIADSKIGSIKSQRYYEYFKGRLSNLTVYFHRRDYDEVLKLLTEKYSVKTPDDLTIAEHQWENGVSTIALLDGFGNRKNPMLLFSHDKLTSEQNEARRQQVLSNPPPE